MKLPSKSVSFSRVDSEQTNLNNSLNSNSISVSEPAVEKPAIKENSSSELSLVRRNTLTSDNDRGENDRGEIVQWSPSMQSLLDEPPSNLPQRLIWGGLAFCLIAFIWAWFGQVEEIGKARGKLVPNGETYKVEPVELGKVNQVMVSEGDRVKAGQVLVELNSELATKEAERLQQMLASYQTELNQKQALLEKVRSEAQTDKKIAAAEAQSYQSSMSLAREKVAIARQLLDRRQTELVAYKTKQTQLKPISGLMQERLKQLEAEAIAHKKRLERLRPLEQQGAVSQDFIFQAEQGKRQVEQQLTQSKLQEETSTKEQLFQAEQSLRELQAGIVQNQGDLASAIKEVERLQAEMIQKQGEWEKNQLEAKQKIAQFEVDITQMKATIAETKNQLASIKTKLGQNYLKAPINGTILSLDVKNTGKVVQAGETVAEIAPYGEPLVLSAVLPNKDAGFVEVGMPAQVKFDAYSYQDFGVIPGRVVSISADSKLTEQQDEVYQVKIALQRNYIKDRDRAIKFKPGQTAEADIVIRRRRLIDVFLEPIKRMEKDGIDL
ncbi:HlyD family efflux transporter periplasmic adaptor subunit [Myxosarcina sp. GI1]|uniref:HlyD family efflux transporter periplasmic adaptor subunit n=1 Tax=Myxosarcina sp. GI1 TaxID=1541065 RepID=UPI00056BEBAA|nr:HlyD family efflux transporter periplasmic adaptor subunit [Myxosarcina sp. GI1]